MDRNASTSFTMIFAVADYLVTPYRPFGGYAAKNDIIIAKAVEHPERFLVSPRSGDPEVLVAQLLTDPRNASWEVWRNDTFVGILCLDRVVPFIDARLQFVFFDDELASKAPLLNEFVERCFVELGLQRLTFEAPEHMTMLTTFARRKLGFNYEGSDTTTGVGAARVGSRRDAAYHDGERWCAVTVLRRLANAAT